MAEHEFKLTGWKALVGALFFVCLAGVRIFALNNGVDDPDLAAKIQLLLTSDYLPQQVDALKTAMASGDSGQISEAALMVRDSGLNIHSIRTSYPILGFSTAKKVVVKVIYAFGQNGNGQRKVKYYTFRHGAIGNSWQYKHETTVLSFYLNLF